MIDSLHAPEQRELVAMIDTWELRQLATTRSGAGHVQLWSPEQRISIVTPSRATRGAFDAWITGERVSARAWPVLHRELVRRGLEPPGRHTMRALERWFVYATESATGRLLRAWWRA